VSDKLEHILSRIFETDTRVLADIRSFVADFASEAGLGTKELEELQLAVDEAATNVIKHAASIMSCCIDCTCGITTDHKKVVYEIAWEAAGQFTPTEPQKENILNRIRSKTPGGLGIFLMHHLVDEIDYDYRNGQSVIRLVKYIQ
jgi:serine/threonine-protein kinase RsbW